MVGVTGAWLQTVQSPDVGLCIEAHDTEVIVRELHNRLHTLVVRAVIHTRLYHGIDTLAGSRTHRKAERDARDTLNYHTGKPTHREGCRSRHNFTN